MQTLILDVAGMEFVHRVLKLYKSTKYYGDKQILGKMFLDHAIETGRLLEEVEQASGVGKIYPAQRACDELKKAMYALKVMCEQGYYSRRRTAPVTSLAEEIESNLQYYVSGPISVGHEEVVKTVESETAISSPEESVEAIPENTETQPVEVIPEKLEEKGAYDPLGFTDVYEG